MKVTYILVLVCLLGMASAIDCPSVLNRLSETVSSCTAVSEQCNANSANCRSKIPPLVEELFRCLADSNFRITFSEEKLKEAKKSVDDLRKKLEKACCPLDEVKAAKEKARSACLPTTPNSSDAPLSCSDLCKSNLNEFQATLSKCAILDSDKKALEDLSKLCSTSDRSPCNAEKVSTLQFKLQELRSENKTCSEEFGSVLQSLQSTVVNCTKFDINLEKANQKLTDNIKNIIKNRNEVCLDVKKNKSCFKIAKYELQKHLESDNCKDRCSALCRSGVESIVNRLSEEKCEIDGDFQNFLRRINCHPCEEKLKGLMKGLRECMKTKGSCSSNQQCKTQYDTLKSEFESCKAQFPGLNDKIDINIPITSYEQFCQTGADFKACVVDLADNVEETYRACGGGVCTKDCYDKMRKVDLSGCFVGNVPPSVVQGANDLKKICQKVKTLIFKISKAIQEFDPIAFQIYLDQTIGDALIIDVKASNTRQSSTLVTVLSNGASPVADPTLGIQSVQEQTVDIDTTSISPSPAVPSPQAPNPAPVPNPPPNPAPVPNPPKENNSGSELAFPFFTFTLLFYMLL